MFGIDIEAIVREVAKGIDYKPVIEGLNMIGSKMDKMNVNIERLIKLMEADSKKVQK